MIWVIGGTSETGEFIERIHGSVDYLVTVATYVGIEVLEGKNVLVKRLDYEGMLDLIKKKRISKVIDLSHPYAVEVSKNARKAASVSEISYVRYVREKTLLDDGKIIKVKDIEECKEYLKTIEGTIFFTSGSKNIGDFEKVKGKNRFIYRVLPSKFSLEECIENKLDLKDIVAILGPFSKEFNLSMFKEYKADYVVLKDSGDKGGSIEKLRACKELGIKAIMIERQDEDGIDDIEKLVEMIL